MYVVYGKPGCSFCDKAKALLEEKGIDYASIDLTENPEELEWLKSLGCRTVPQIFVMGEDDASVEAKEHVGGYENLVRYLKD